MNKTERNKSENQQHHHDGKGKNNKNFQLKMLWNRNAMSNEFDYCSVIKSIYTIYLCKIKSECEREHSADTQEYIISIWSFDSNHLWFFFFLSYYCFLSAFVLLANRTNRNSQFNRPSSIEMSARYLLTLNAIRNAFTCCLMFIRMTLTNGITRTPNNIVM